LSKRPSPDAWADARRRWESDPKENFETIGQLLGVSRVAASKKAAKEGWERVQNMRQIVEKAQRKADVKQAKKVAAKVSEGKTETKKVSAETLKAETVEGAVDIRANVLEQHRGDWQGHRELFPLEGIRADFETGKKAKISAEMLMIRQKGERAAYGLDMDEGADSGFEKMLAEIHEAAKP
jgi:hypothetical protein